MRECHSILCFLFSLPVQKYIKLQYQQGLDEFKRKKKGIRNEATLIRACMGDGKHGKSWNYRSSFSRPGKSWNFESSIGNTVRDYFKETAIPHFLNVTIRCIVLIKSAFSQARHPSPPSLIVLN